MFEMMSAGDRNSISACLGWDWIPELWVTVSGLLSLACVILEPQPTKSTVGRLRRGLANLISCLSYYLKGQTGKCSILFCIQFVSWDKGPASRSPRSENDSLGWIERIPGEGLL